MASAMRTNRSVTRSLSAAANGSAPAAVTAAKRKVSETKETAAPAVKKSRKPAKPKAAPKTDENAMEPPPAPERPRFPVDNLPAEPLLPATLSFSFEDAKRALIQRDPRFEDIFEKLPCRPFEHLERIDPFRTLVTSILGQQISWLAARSITHRFIRLFDESLPEKPEFDEHGKTKTSTFFPSAAQVANMDPASLRTAGLSGRKVEYVQDLATRFADGRLSSNKILEANDEELAEMLIEVRGIGRWTVDMFAIFSLRRPDILPFGDLGVQRGMLRWFLSLHSPKHQYSISPKKLPKAPTEEPEDPVATGEVTIPLETNPEKGEEPAAGLSSIPPAPSTPVPPATPGRRVKDPGSPEPSGFSALPTPFTPSINRTLNKNVGGQRDLPPLPQGLTVEVMKSRLDSKKKIKGAFLSPQEMTELAEMWRPYRSIGTYYMWALSEEK